MPITNAEGNTYVIANLNFDSQEALTDLNRPFKTVDEMNETLIANWNSVVGEKDHCYILGGIGSARHKSELRKYLSRLNGSVRLVYGDDEIAPGCGGWLFETYISFTSNSPFVIDKKYLVSPEWLDMSPTSEYLKNGFNNPRPQINVHGNPTNTLNDSKLNIDVSADKVNFTPVLLAGIETRLGITNN